MNKKNGRLDAPVLSIQDIIDAYNNYDASEEAKEIIIYFVSELTGLSVDTIAAMGSGA